jgi:hypothetical protein
MESLMGRNSQIEVRRVTVEARRVTDWGSAFRAMSKTQRGAAGTSSSREIAHLRVSRSESVPQYTFGDGPSFGGEPFGRFGSDASDAVVAYRALWNAYVMNTARAMADANQSLRTIAKNPPPGPITAKQLTDLADTYDSESNALLAIWNQFAGTSPGQFTAETDVILSAFQGGVKDAQTFWTEMKTAPLRPVGDEPPQPSQADQAHVQSLIDQSGAATGGIAKVLQGTWQKDTTLPPIPSASSVIADIEKAAIQFAKDHWLPITLGVVGVSLGLTIASKLAHGYVKVMTGGLL